MRSCVRFSRAAGPAGHSVTPPCAMARARALEPARAGEAVRAGAILVLAAGVLAAGVLLAAAPAAAQDPVVDDRPGVAVLPFENGSFGPDRHDFEMLTVGLQHMLLTELAQNSSLRIVERSQLRAILEEQELAASGRVDAGTAARVGRLVGARYIVAGSFVDVNEDFRMDARIFDVETSEYVGTPQQVRDQRDRIYDLLVELAEKLTVQADLPPLPSEVREARGSREIPGEAVILFSRAQTYEDFGDRERAVEVYQRIVAEFPEMTEAREALEQISGS